MGLMNRHLVHCGFTRSVLARCELITIGGDDIPAVRLRLIESAVGAA